MTQTFRQSLDASVEKVKQMNSDIRKVDFSKWPTYPSGVAKFRELQDDPTYTSMRDMDGSISLVLANLEIVLSNESHHRDPAKAFERFSDSLVGDKHPDGYFSDGLISAGVLDTALEVDLVTKAEADILTANRPWHGKYSPAEAADHVDKLLEAIQEICVRIDADE